MNAEVRNVIPEKSETPNCVYLCNLAALILPDGYGLVPTVWRSPLCL